MAFWTLGSFAAVAENWAVGQLAVEVDGVADGGAVCDVAGGVGDEDG
ncbi:MAG TPA: hypothetical protein VF772_10820 [Terriglobales bacterium]